MGGAGKVLAGLGSYGGRVTTQSKHQEQWMLAPRNAITYLTAQNVVS